MDKYVIKYVEGRRVSVEKIIMEIKEKMKKKKFMRMIILLVTPVVILTGEIITANDFN